MVIDPVCKMKVDEKTAKFKSEYQEKNYYFCAPGCKKAFDNNPEKYLKKIEEDRPI
jgi:YHS domain-containing protein